MKFQVLVSFLSLIISLANAQAATPTEHYINCVQQMMPGLFATYHCGQATALGVSAKGNTATNPDACVLACEQTSGCVGSMWSARPGPACYLVEHQGEPELRVKTRVAYMTYRREEIVDDPFPEEECEDRLEDVQT
ncbi:uncharacterized protein ATNIH1004_005451 [Aspergillus tanneri]|uniref:Apple domain-containing protein n=1 Tax=Aspergillus tanneri TaxID=1220188 RepID=A0A5M9MLJ4_9EURO|nr:uncharacterized protein ATNIH1004_005451 [Aspergillus tanneri]KAA8646776.1 hypothetical protein ATNIH1004_005451 [Aspergillus tanneri]